jgi:hypothetical protein
MNVKLTLTPKNDNVREEIRVIYYTGMTHTLMCELSEAMEKVKLGYKLTIEHGSELSWQKEAIKLWKNSAGIDAVTKTIKFIRANNDLGMMLKDSREYFYNNIYGK